MDHVFTKRPKQQNTTSITTHQSNFSVPWVSSCQIPATKHRKILQWTGCVKIFVTTSTTSFSILLGIHVNTFLGQKYKPVCVIYFANSFFKLSSGDVWARLLLRFDKIILQVFDLKYSLTIRGMWTIPSAGNLNHQNSDSFSRITKVCQE